MTYVTNNPIFGWEVRCEPGETEYPADCERHSEHYWCETCQGFYGVPHDGGMHDGPNAHPNHWSVRDCVCRMCINWRIERSRRATEAAQ